MSDLAILGWVPVYVLGGFVYYALKNMVYGGDVGCTVFGLLAWPIDLVLTTVIEVTEELILFFETVSDWTEYQLNRFCEWLAACLRLGWQWLSGRLR